MDPPFSPITYSDGLKKETWRHSLILSFQTLGVVYGRFSTAPLYVFGTIHTTNFKSNETAYEYFSFLFWTLTIVSLLKYTFIVLRADDNGEGGIFALYSLLCRHCKVGLLPNDRSTEEIMQHEEVSTLRGKVESRARKAIRNRRSSHYLMLFTALFGACMIIGDGVITPSISVLSASSGLQRSLSNIKYTSSTDAEQTISDDLRKYVPVPSACVITYYGTHKIGFMFAPIVTLWLLFISGVGIYNVFHWDPKIFSAISPVYMYRFVRKINKASWKSLNSILLCVAGSETMFTDLGHFSKRSIKLTFVCLIYPILVLCYAGQAAFISKHWNGTENFNHLSESVPSKYGSSFRDDSNDLYDVTCDYFVLGEEFIIGSIGEFISLEESDCESLTSPEGRMMIVGKPLVDSNALIPIHDTNSDAGSINIANNETLASPSGDFMERKTAVRRKKVRFLIPDGGTRMRLSVREELQELIDARESGTAYFLGQSHLTVRDDSNFFKKFLIMAFVFLDKNCREPPVALNIPHAALVESAVEDN
ncbi:hypothetical protein SADUNF_Sadunf15G0028900 [Salix dunnii]|uniref:K+ potassium transporter integral membrane domain-containing protein n=1 Tax=Salix dunnii TaxID=1413687 RepID=A0A835JHY8_9ROSI|nr:hypothetical protein SADUNF_Sadunf15G0028900 [Salix dunnii]